MFEMDWGFRVFGGFNEGFEKLSFGLVVGVFGLFKVFLVRCWKLIYVRGGEG